MIFLLWGMGGNAQQKNKRRNCTLQGTREDGAMSYEVKLDKSEKRSVVVALEMEFSHAGAKQAAAFPYPIKEDCGEGLMALGDWGGNEGLRYYSGGMLYKKSFTLNRIDTTRTYQIDLGEVVSTAELSINGHRVGLRMCAPWKFDVTPYLKEGSNELQVKVYNTSYNQYLSIPTRYNARQTSGILGPVRLDMYEK